MLTRDVAALCVLSSVFLALSQCSVIHQRWFLFLKKHELTTVNNSDTAFPNCVALEIVCENHVFFFFLLTSKATFLLIMVIDDDGDGGGLMVIPIFQADFSCSSHILP